MFRDSLLVKYKGNSLPGLEQIEQGHFEAWHWDESRPVRADEWSAVVQGGHGLKLAFILGAWFSSPK